MHNIALIAPIENDIDNINHKKRIVNIVHSYEQEAIKCFSAWRKNGGWLSDIPIYCICQTHNNVSLKTLQKFKELNITYIENYDSIVESFSSGFLLLPYSGMYFEESKNIKENILIRIDLDMNLLKPIPESLISAASKNIIIGQYDVDSIKDQRISFKDEYPFDTGFMITNKKFKFYKQWFDLCCSNNLLNDATWKSIKQKLGDYYLEEFAIDYMFNHKLIKNIKPIQKYQFGEGYASIDTFSDEQLKTLYFLHEHIYYGNKFIDGYDSARERIKYLKRIK
jgi:hypothetical protein